MEQIKRGTRIAVTGFGPFPGVPFNASGLLAEHLAEAAPRRVKVAAAVLPVEWRRAAAEARRLIEAVEPHIILHFGVSAGARGFVIETRAVNRTSPRADQANAVPPDICVRRGAAPVLTAPVPAERMARRLRLAGIAAAVSRDAGRYLCNAVFYETLAHVRRMRRPPLAAFIHIPALTAAQVAGGGPSVACGWGMLRTGAGLMARLAAEEAGNDVPHASMLRRPRRC
jgi:pyroglutamyl-peptidase